MATLINDIKDGIEARINVVRPSYKRLAYQVDVSQNKFKGNSKGYAVHPVTAEEVDGLVGAYTLDHEFKVTLVNSYNNGPTSNIGDSIKSQRLTELTDDILEIYRDLVINKNNVEPSILLLNNMSIEEAEFIETEKVISITFTFNIKYKVDK